METIQTRWKVWLRDLAAWPWDWKTRMGPLMDEDARFTVPSLLVGVFLSLLVLVFNPLYQAPMTSAADAFAFFSEVFFVYFLAGASYWLMVYLSSLSEQSGPGDHKKIDGLIIGYTYLAVIVLFVAGYLGSFLTRFF